MLFMPLAKPGDAAEIELAAEHPQRTLRGLRLHAHLLGLRHVPVVPQRPPLGKPFDAETQTRGCKSLPPAMVDLKSGPRTLRVEAVGKSKYATDYKASLDAIVLVPVK